MNLDQLRLTWPTSTPAEPGELRTLDTSAESLALLARLIVEAATEQGIAVTAGGIETADQDELRALGSGSAKGLHLLTPNGRPAAREERAVSLGQAAQLLGISASTLRRWAEDGRVSAVRTSGGHRRFYLSELSRLNPAGEAQLRKPALPVGPLPAVGELLAAEGLELATAAVRSLYDERPGWFARTAALDPLRTFMTELAQAFARGSYDRLGDSLRRVMLAATVGGATLAERHLFLERLAGALDGRLARAARPAREQAAARRTLSALALTHLTDCDARSSAPRVPPRRRRASHAPDGIRRHA